MSPVVGPQNVLRGEVGDLTEVLHLLQPGNEVLFQRNLKTYHSLGVTYCSIYLCYRCLQHNHMTHENNPVYRSWAGFYLPVWVLEASQEGRPGN